ncbi:MAG: maleylpyruvate isomerase family mycothiol-dependent enzyme [Nocardioidaceae bacterium]|nr:maleylpyruvate isomerase family mycothiol-dependent enzyme [Nocardioidaceae bacterium]
MTTTDDAIVAETQAERARLTGLLDDLEPEKWDHPSLCQGWRIREVLAHLTMPYRNSMVGVLGGLVRARFSFDRYADRDARATSASMNGAALVALLRDNIDHPWRPPGGGRIGALSHDVIHGLDMTEPLGLPRPPAERVALVLRGSTSRNLRYFGADLDGSRLVATDADVTIGSGAEVRLPVADLLLVVTGRRPLSAATGGA